MSDAKCQFIDSEFLELSGSKRNGNGQLLPLHHGKIRMWDQPYIFMSKQHLMGHMISFMSADLIPQNVMIHISLNFFDSRGTIYT